jgi:hypothetical protein
LFFNKRILENLENFKLKKICGCDKTSHTPNLLYLLSFTITIFYPKHLWRKTFNKTNKKKKKENNNGGTS